MSTEPNQNDPQTDETNAAASETVTSETEQNPAPPETNPTPPETTDATPSDPATAGEASVVETETQAMGSPAPHEFSGAVFGRALEKLQKFRRIANGVKEMQEEFAPYIRLFREMLADTDLRDALEKAKQLAKDAVSLVTASDFHATVDAAEIDQAKEEVATYLDKMSAEDLAACVEKTTRHVCSGKLGVYASTEDEKEFEAAAISHGLALALARAIAGGIAEFFMRRKTTS